MSSLPVPAAVRGQTTLDFAIAMGVFLLTIGFVFTFVPSMTAPFVDGTQDHSAVADRVASHLSEGSLADPDDPYVLNVTCTTEFFDDAAAPAHCGYAVSGFQDRIGVSDRTNVNVTLVHVEGGTGTRTTLCDDGNGNVVKKTSSDCNPGSGDVVYNIGERPATNTSITTARRIVSIDGQDATLLVKVW